MYRQNFSSSDPYNTFNSSSPYNSYNYSSPFTSYNPSYNNYSSYRNDVYPHQYEETPSMSQSLDMFAIPCSFCKCRFHTASDCYHLHGALPISNQQWLGQHQMGNQYNNTNNYGWSCEPSFRREEGNNCGFPNYQWEPSSQYEMPTPPHLITPIQQESRSDEYQALLDELKKNISKIEKYNEEEQERLNNVHANKSFETSNQLINSPLSQLEILAEKHEQDYVLQPALRFDEQQVEKDEPSLEEESEDEGNTIIIDDIPFVTPPSFSCDAGQQFNNEDHTMQDETETCPSNVLARDESYIPLSDLVAHFEYNDDSDYTGIIQWVVIREVIEHQEDREDENESTKESSKDESNIDIIDDFVSVTPLSFPCVVSGNWCDEDQSNLGTAEVPKEILVLEEEDQEEEKEKEYMDPSIVQDNQCNKEDNFCCLCNDKPCKYCKEIEEWLTMDQSLETAEVSKKIMEQEEEKEFVDPPPLIIHEQLEIEKTPLYINFVIPFHTTSTSLSIYSFISVCGVGVKKFIHEEHADQRVGSVFCSLQRRRLLPLWIFKENLKPD